MENLPGDRVPARTWLTSILGNNGVVVSEIRIVRNHSTRRRRKEWSGGRVRKVERRDVVVVYLLRMQQ